MESERTQQILNTKNRTIMKHFNHINFLIILFLALLTSLFISCSDEDKEYFDDQNKSYESLGINFDTACVEINGVKWATRNIAAPGTFVDYPEYYGMAYQWNSKIGWDFSKMSPSDGTSTWDSDWTGGTDIYTWSAENDPSPDGFHVPTYAEIESLLDEDKVSNTWMVVWEVYGQRFTDKENGNAIFLPAAGYINKGTFDHYGYDYCGGYWCSITDLDNIGYFLEVCEEHTPWTSSCYRALGLTIRPVAD